MVVFLWHWRTTQYVTLSSLQNETKDAVVKFRVRYLCDPFKCLEMKMTKLYTLPRIFWWQIPWKPFFLEIIGIDSISSKTDQNPICEVNLRSKVWISGQSNPSAIGTISKSINLFNLSQLILALFKSKSIDPQNSSSCHPSAAIVKHLR